MSELKDLHKYNSHQGRSGKEKLLQMNKLHVDRLFDWYYEYEALNPDLTIPECKYLTNRLEQKGGQYEQHEDPFWITQDELKLILRWHRMGRKDVFVDDFDKVVWEKIDSALNPDKYLTEEDWLPPAPKVVATQSPDPTPPVGTEDKDKK